ncbi:DUF4041 domain-containing protein [Kineosporia sp. NBRC 101731]|uniref:DUF4041 domain-containing protein n=1 Tax=Kineosporia sp. NBRC 101731 TaxID=3032199 RepID=UPI0024A5CFBA|nr:DUF4041 domain-containing protein [Kineosporia sp. NBRC 101731]GLY32521.1 hypothetical protein Kisp02_58860 [Kineosporia sp. NBRC 101731]
MFGARKQARELGAALTEAQAENDRLREHLERLGALGVVELEERRRQIEREIEQRLVDSEHELREYRISAEQDLSQLQAQVEAARRELEVLRQAVVETEEISLLQEAGVYRYRHPLDDAVAYKAELARLRDKIKTMTLKDGGAVSGAANWTVNGSSAEGRKMMRETSKMMLRAYNAEADNLVRGLKPYKLDPSVERLTKVMSTIERLGRTLEITISPAYHRLRIRELELTADFAEKVAREKEHEREEKARLREERKVQEEIERERARLVKEQQHYLNALARLEKMGDTQAIEKMRAQLSEIGAAIENVDYRAANVRAGYVYVISNIGAFGSQMVKIGMTRRLEPMDRVRELGDASVPFRFDVHALFFTEDAVGIESRLHSRFAEQRVNRINARREFFYVTPTQVRDELLQLTGGNLLTFEELPEAIEFRQSETARQGVGAPA